MEDTIEDLIQETEITLRDAYRRGYEKGSKPNKAMLESKADMLRAFEAHLSKFRRIEDSEREPVFIPKKTDGIPYGSFLTTIIKNFLLTYDDNEED
jgi:hypothetical protein